MNKLPGGLSVNEKGMLNKRPLSPRLSVYRWRVTMIASLAHRASGMLLVLFVPLYLWLLHGMTGSPAHFLQVQAWMHSGLGQLSLWLVGTAFIYHFCNGIRFLCIDTGWCEGRDLMRNSARLVFAFTLVASLLLGVML